MFKKLEAWILYLILLLGLPTIIGFGFLVRQELVGRQKLGSISKTALFLSEIPVKLKKFLVDDVEVPDRFVNLDGFNGKPNISETFLLLSRYDGNLREGIVELVDLTNFEVLHTWNPDVDGFNKLVKKSGEFKYLDRDKNNKRFIPRHPQLMNDGNLIYKWHGPLIKVDECSNLIFQNTHDVFHHSLEIDIDGNIWVPSHMYPQTMPAEKVGRNIIEEGGYADDAIVKLSPKGEILFEKSVSQILIDNGLEFLLFAQGNSYKDDPIHLNDIQPVNFDGKYWRKGDLFLSLRDLSTIILYRPSNNKIIWKGNGPFFSEHDVDILDSQRISIFNNRMIRTNTGRRVDGNNEVIIYNFNSKKYDSYLSKSLIEHDVRTTSEGSSEILPNGDLIIEETNFGRTLYFNSDGSLRWSHLNRADNGKVYRVNWSRILYKKSDILNVKNFLTNKKLCNN